MVYLIYIYIHIYRLSCRLCQWLGVEKKNHCTLSSDIGYIIIVAYGYCKQCPRSCYLVNICLYLIVPYVCLFSIVNSIAFRLTIISNVDIQYKILMLKQTFLVRSLCPCLSTTCLNTYCLADQCKGSRDIMGAVTSSLQPKLILQIRVDAGTLTCPLGFILLEKLQQ